jgi:hypothetical protein
LLKTYFQIGDAAPLPPLLDPSLVQPFAYPQWDESRRAAAAPSRARRKAAGARLDAGQTALERIVENGLECDDHLG